MLFDNRVEIMDVRGGLVDPSLVRGGGESQPEHTLVIPDATSDVVSGAAFGELYRATHLESLILAQDERWRRA
jgi:hypothetical protein